MTRDSWALRRGDEIDGDLVVIEELGGGPRYEVYLVWDRDLFCQAVAKLIRPHRLMDERALAGFEREAAIAARLAHPNLVRLMRTSTALPHPYIELELVTAGSLGEHLRDVGAVSVPEICLLGIRMCSALQYLHASGVLHLDVKPDNVTIGDPPRLLDLGLARTVSGPLRLSSAVGTRRYMPPEQCDPGVVTPQSDLWSLGVTLYEGVSRLRPFSGGGEAASGPERYPQLVDDPVPLGDVAHVPDRFEAIVMRCLDRDPRRRPPSATDVAIGLERVLEDLGLDELLAWPRGLPVLPAARR